MALPKDGYPASSKGYDIRDIVKDYDAEQVKQRVTKAVKKIARKRRGK